MTIPTFRSVDAHTGEVADGGSMAVTIREIDQMRIEIVALRTQLAQAKEALAEAKREGKWNIS